MKILIEQEQHLHRYEVRQQVAEISRLLHPSFIEVGRSGRTYTFEGIKVMMLSEKPSDLKVHSQNYEFTMLTASVQLLRYRSALVTAQGVASQFAIRSSIWVFCGENWQMKYHQATVCNEFELIQ